MKLLNFINILLLFNSMAKRSSKKNQNLTAIKFRNFIKNNGIFIYSLIFLLIITAAIFFLNMDKNEKNENMLYGDDMIEMHYFYLSTCPHCHEQEKFHSTILEKYPNVKIFEYEMTKTGSLERYQRMAKNLEGLDPDKFPGTPLSIIGNETNIGFGSSETTGQKLLDMIEKEHMRIMNNWNESMITTEDFRKQEQNE